MADRKHALYRFFNADGDLLYVGITMNPGARWAQHRGDKAWWHDVTDITVEVMDSRQAALDAEREAIKTELPRFNVVHVERSQPEPTPVANRLRWVCAACSSPIPDGGGFLAAFPCLGCQQPERYPHAHWFSLHNECVEHAETDPFYEITVGQVRSPEQLLAWTGHLMTKSWMSDSHWDELIRQTLHDSGLVEAVVG